jgi:hypothetical protein
MDVPSVDSFADKVARGPGEHRSRLRPCGVEDNADVAHHMVEGDVSIDRGDCRHPMVRAGEGHE